jgi:hypothetical protein
MLDNPKYLIAIPTTAAVLLYSAAIGTTILPKTELSHQQKKEESIMRTLGTKTAANMSWDSGVGLNVTYNVTVENQKIEKQIYVINNFVSMLLEESQDLDPKYSAIVDKYFWDLA